MKQEQQITWPYCCRRVTEPEHDRKRLHLGEAAGLSAWASVNINPK